MTAPIDLTRDWRPAISPAEFVLFLHRHGVTLTVAPDGALLASPGGLLTDPDRAVLAAHRKAIVAILSETVRVA